jgi:glucosyl-3-phosphoglycerate synthase
MLPAVERWLARRTYDRADFPLERLQAAKRQTVSVVVPAKQCAETLPGVLTPLLILRDHGIVDELLVVDADSGDGTIEVCAQLGVAVAQEDELLAQFGPAHGKGDAMWRGLWATSGEIVAFLDGDSTGLQPDFVRGLLGPLLCHDELALVKGAFARPFQPGGGATPIPDGGGRVTELMARPLINLHMPELAGFVQPLAGEVAARRDLLERLPFPVGYGVEIAMLIDALRDVGLDRLAQAHLGVRQNRHQPLRALGAMAYAILVTAERRLGRAPQPGPYELPGAPAQRLVLDERPPLAEIRARGDGADQAQWLTSPPIATARSSSAARSR